MQIKYKFLILTMLLCSWNSFLSAQDPRPFWVLNSNESDDTKKYVARESITLQNSGTGFYFKAEGGKTFSAKIDAGLLFPPTIDTYLMPDGVHTSSNPADGVAVGSIPGQFGVSPTGGASYSIPIESPAGINGMKPNLTLVYNSQGGNGTTGIGWQISGLSVIGKTMKNIFSDSIVSGLDLSKREKYMIDGNTLLGLANIYGSDGATYQTENKTYSLIKSMGQVNNVLVDPFNRTCSEYTSYPVSFIVTSKDGQTVEYGNTNFTKIIPIQVIVSRDGNTSTVKYSQPLQWLINKVTDANGNFMTFSYVEDAGIIPTIKSINYGDLSIEFDYDQKAIIAKSFINGYYLLDKYLLRHIRIISKGTKTVKTTLKQYDLNYDYDSKKGKYFLKDVALVGLDNVKINSTKIEWGNDYSTINTNTTLIPNTSNYWSEESNKNFTSCDIDGDGTSEVVEFFHRVDYTSRGNGNDSFSLGDYVRVHKMKLENGVVSFDRTLPPYTIGGSFAFPDFKSLNEGGFFADFKGDGKKTIIVPIYKEDNGQKGERIKDVISGLSFDQLFSYSSEMGVHAVGDINNDGVDEIILMEKAYYSRVPGPKGKIYYIENNKVIVDEFNFSGSIVSADRSLISGKPKSIFISDFNGDGLKDLMITTEIGCFFMKNNGSVKRTDGIFHVSFTEMSNNIITDFNSSSLKIKPGDFNGDGLIDFVINQNYVWKLFINNGRWGFDNYPLQDSNNSNLYTDKYDLIVTDFNHDGKSDIILQNSDYSTVPDPNDPYNPGANITTFNNVAVNWYASTGLKFNLDNTDISLDENLDLNKNSVEGDFNMDGKADIVNCKPTASAGTTLNFYSTLNTTTTNFNSNFEANQVKSITDGMGIKTEVEYRALTYDKLTDQNLFYTKGAGSVYPVADFTAPINCVRSVKQPIDNVNTSTTEYQYSGAKVQLTGKGFLGFTSQKSSNVTTNKYVVSTTELEYPYCLPKTQTVVTSALTGGNSTTNGEISRVVTTITNTKSTDKVYTSLLSSSVETNSLNGISKTTNYNSYDTSGNLTGVEIIQGDLTTTQTIGYGQFGSWAWCPNKPISNITTKTLKGEPLVYTREKTYDYNTTSGNLIQQISDPTDTKNKVTTTYPDFDTWGHPITVKVETPGKTPRTSYVKYTDSGRFVDYEINHLGEKTKYEWGDEITGLLSSKTDYQDHVTSYTYNGLGQLTETKYANGIRKANVMQWAKSDNIYGAKYYDYSETSGSAPVWVWYDVYGREILKQTFGLNSNTINVFTKYKNDGKVDCVSEPSFVETVDKVATNKWAAKYTYNDPYGRVTSVVTPMGETITKYKDSEKKTEVTTPEGLSITEQNNIGQTYISTVNEKTVTYVYDAAGRTKTSTPQGGLSITMTYDLQGNRTKLEDPDAGTVESVYNGFGELTEEKQIVHPKKQQVKTTNHYLDDGLIDYSVRENIENYDTGTPTILHSETTSYIYDTEPKHTTRVKTIKIDDGKKQTFGYDEWDRVTAVDETVGTKVFNRKTEYDFFGRVKKEVYPTGYYTLNTYDKYSYLTEVKDSQRSIWKAVDENAKGQLLHASKGGKTITYDFDERGFPTGISADGVIKAAYSFNAKGNLEYRTDELDPNNIQKEVFIGDGHDYDTQNRLTYWGVYIKGILVKPNTITYDPTSSNITTKSDLGPYTFGYGGNRPDPDNSAIGPHALATISGVPSSFPIAEPSYPTAELNVTYTDFKKIATLSEKNKYYELTYGVDDQRRMSMYKENNVSKETRYYLGNYEEKIDNTTGITQKIHYLSGAILIQETNQPDKFYYSYSDYQGSLIALTDANGGLVTNGRFAYDPWGIRRNPDDWSQNDSRTTWIVNRGYTGHEHLDAFGIINMNGRVYDPYTTMFFSPDPYVQTPDNWVNYNRYLYAYGNPFKYTDPSGEFFYIMPNIGMDYNGGISIGLTVGIGMPGFGVSASFSYGLSSGGWSVTAGIGAGGFNAYIGFASGNGMIAGLGYNFGGAGGFSTNMIGLGVNWSESGGASANMFGWQMSQSGMSFNPGVGAGITLKYGTEVVYSNLSNDVTSRKNSCFKSQQEVIDHLNEEGQGVGKNGVTSVDYENTVFPDKDNTRDADGIIRTKNGGIASAVTYLHYNGLSVTGSIFMSPHTSSSGFDVTFNHELIHLYHYNKYSGGKLVNNKLKSYSESVAHSYNQTYFQNEIAPEDYSGYGYSHTDIPNYLIPVTLPLIQQRSYWLK